MYTSVYVYLCVCVYPYNVPANSPKICNEQPYHLFAILQLFYLNPKCSQELLWNKRGTINKHLMERTN